MIFETERLLVRQLTENDIEDFHALQQGPDVMRYIRKPMNRPESTKELKRFVDCYTDSAQTFLIWAVIEKLENSFLGICGVYVNRWGEHELAYRFLAHYWGNGYGQETLGGLIRHCFEKLGLSELTAYVHVENKRSIRVVKKYMNHVKTVYSEDMEDLEQVFQIKSTKR